MNTRLQVEHPVTELVPASTSCACSCGWPAGSRCLPKRQAPLLQGHAIEARLYAEDPQRDFLPTTGTLYRFRAPTLPGVRVDSGVEEGTVLSPYYDALLAKVIAHAPTRLEAAAKLARALVEMRLHGVVTNRDFLVRLLRHPAFLAGSTDTGFLERHAPELAVPLADAQAERLHAAAAALAAQSARRQQARVLATLPSGWRNNPSQLQETVFRGRYGDVRVGYRFTRHGLYLHLDGEEQPRVRLGRCTPDVVELEVDGVRRTYEVHAVADTSFVDSPLGASVLREHPRFPPPAPPAEAGTLCAPLPGQVVRVAVREGEAVSAGTLLVVIESMKMQHLITAPRAGRVHALRVQEGQQVEAGTVLVVLDEAAGA
ncbi:MAG: hypothetical protein KatS3mg131_2711 [Candidatus Tectimicrobiota bacterium]|nr:MAG: hypothetical protein KatS3mg131_2711 [Candidatus Tectomicrobia bacterium]